MNKNKKIIIIEDQIILGEVIFDKLVTEGFTTFWEKNGKDGFEKIKEIKPDLVLLDIVMPIMDGYDVLEAINKDSSLKDIPVIIISNSGQPLEIKRITELGAKDYIIKADFTPKDVMDKVKMYINSKMDKNEDKKKESKGLEKSSIKILIVEDDPFLVSISSKSFPREGYHVTFANDGEQVFKYLENDIPHLILLDIVMPGMNGFEVIKKIKEDPRYSKIFVIIFSNLGQEHEISEGLRLGADKFLIKANFTPKGIISFVNDFLKEKGLV